MVLSRTKESQAHDLILAGYSQRNIARKVEVCLATINHRVQLYRATGSTQLKPKKRKTRYEPIEELTKQRIRYYLSLETRKCKFTVAQLYEKILQEGYLVSKSKLQKWIHLERNRLKESYLDIFHEPGQTVQFDWGTKRILIKGKNQTVCFAVFAFPYSNYRFIHVTERMDGRSFVDAFIAFTKHIGGVYPTLLIDNMKIAARHKSYCNHQPKLTTLFQQLEKHYNFEARLCTPYRPNQKGTVENTVKTLKTHLFDYQSGFTSLDELQEKIHTIFHKLNNMKHHEKNDTIINLLQHEKNLKRRLYQKRILFITKKR